MQAHKQRDRDKVEGNNFHFLLFYSPQPCLCPFVYDHQSLLRNKSILLKAIEKQFPMML